MKLVLDDSIGVMYDINILDIVDNGIKVVTSQTLSMSALSVTY